GKTVGAVLKQQYPITSAAYAPDASQVVTGSLKPRERWHQPEEVVQRWDAATSKPLGVSVEHACGLNGLLYLPDGRTPYWTPSLDIRMTEGVGTVAGNVGVSPDGQFAVTAGFDYKARIWDLIRRNPVGQPIYDTGWLHRALFRPDGQAFLFSKGNHLQLWDF